MDWDNITRSFLDELEKIAAERKKPAHEKLIDNGAPVLTGAGLGRTLSDLSMSTQFGASPRRKTIGTLLGAVAGGAYRFSQSKKKERKKAHKALQKKAAAFQFKGVATKRFLSKPGKTVHDLAPKIGRLGVLPK